MAFILAGDMGAQGAAAAPPPAVETRVAGAPVATGTPFGGWRLVAQSTSTNSGSMAAPGSVSTPGNGSNGTNGPSGTNGTNGTNQGAPDYGPNGGAGAVPTPNGSAPATTTGVPAPSMESAPGSSGAGLGGGLTSPSAVSSGSPSTTPSSPSSGSMPSAPSSTSVPSYGGSTTR